MQKKTTLSFSLSQEEVFVALHYIDSSSMAGINHSLLNELTDKEKKLILGVAERALIARGFLSRVANRQLELSASVFACLGTCANPEKSIIISHTLANGPEEQYFFHAARKMRVIHSVPITAIHQFIAVEDDLAFNKAILSSISIANLPKAKCKDAKIGMDILLEARDTALKGNEQVTETLLKRHLEENLAVLFAKALAKPISNTTIAIIDKTKDKTEGFTIFQSKEYLWQMKPIHATNHSKNMVILCPMDSKEITEEIRLLIAG